MKTKMNRPLLETIYMQLAYALANRSTCKRLQCGCVITSADLETIYSVGYNGTGAGMPNDECRENDVGNCGDIHAEVNALVKAGTRDYRKIMFVTGEPCETCSKLIINSGFSVVYYGDKSPYRSTEGKEILRSAGIWVQKWGVEEWK